MKAAADRGALIGEMMTVALELKNVAVLYLRTK